ncbi:hypothetical protein [Catellatospora citrea]|uniref:Lipoprotein n=1 Tax=Catellatospora citrea TaxID=53366 RepID=A0A8J3P1F2_9ACTN|nr:hypothetical protein [Catellatospora citrea]RKE06160.1 hypothetical protein C8E86_0979 [Catellatospora citrea]GIG00499.1 hypothetical protein Cci01nite_55920 [Catellatospora citrea]
MSGSKTITVGLLALALAAGTTACSPAISAPEPTAYQVSVDLFSGRENPETALSTPVAERIHQDLDSRAAEFQDAPEPAAPLGFRGFVVTPGSGPHPVLRVTPDTVYAVRDGGHRKLADPTGTFYRAILDDIRPRLPRDVVDALP